MKKIVNFEKLSRVNDELLKVLIEGEDSKLRYEMLHYFAAVNKVSEGDFVGTLAFLAKIETHLICDTVIQTRVLELKNRIEC